MVDYPFFDPGATSASRILREVLNYPIYIPLLPGSATTPLVSGDVESLCLQLSRLANIGSRSAGALLAYLHLKGAVSSTPDLKSAARVCVKGAQCGDPYSEYVFGWIKMAEGDPAEAVIWLRRSAKQLFTPAIVDTARFMAGGVGFEGPDDKAAISVLTDAHKLGHRMALVYIAEYLRARNRLWRVLGEIAYPFATWRATRFVTRYPFSSHCFVTSLTTSRPLFKVN